MVAGVVGRREYVEDCSQDGKGKAGAVAWGGLDGSGEVLANFGKELVKVW